MTASLVVQELTIFLAHTAHVARLDPLKIQTVKIRRAVLVANTVARSVLTPEANFINTTV